MYKHPNNEGVSPVIGTILLVAMTVILVAIIVTVMMGLSNAEDGKKVGMNAQAATGTNALLILYGGESLSELVNLEMIDQNSPRGEYVPIWNLSDGTPLNVGIPYTALDVAKPLLDMPLYDTRVNVKGTFSDGQETILLVQPMTFYNVNGPKIPPEPSAVSAYIEKVTFQSVDITDNFGGTTNGFTALWDGYFPARGPKIDGSVISVTLKDSLPNDFSHIIIHTGSAAPERVSDYDSKTQNLKGSAGNTISATLSGGKYSGAKNNQIGIWYIVIDIYSGTNNIIASETWYVEATSATPDMWGFVEKITFQGVDITDNSGTTTTGFTAVKDESYSTRGPKIDGSVINITLKDPLPDGYSYVTIEISSATPGRTFDYWFKYQRFSSYSAGQTISFTIDGGGRYSGVKNNPAGIWKMKIDLYTTYATYLLSETWYIEATVP